MKLNNINSIMFESMMDNILTAYEHSYDEDTVIESNKYRVSIHDVQLDGSQVNVSLSITPVKGLKSNKNTNK